MNLYNEATKQLNKAKPYLMVILSALIALFFILTVLSIWAGAGYLAGCSVQWVATDPVQLSGTGVEVWTALFGGFSYVIFFFVQDGLSNLIYHLLKVYDRYS